MPKHLTGIDHTVILVRDLEAAAATYARLGFTLSPRGQHSAHMGTANYTIMLDQDYFELLSIINPTPNNLRWRDAISQGEGLAAMALQTDDADKAQAEIRSLGIAAGDVMAFSRPVDMPDGTRTQASFRVTEFPLDAVPGLALFVCGHLTRPAVWIPELMRHANTAQRIVEVAALANDPDRAVQPWRRIFGDAAVGTVEGGRAVRIGGHRLLLLTPDACSRRFGGVAIPEPGRDRPLALVFGVQDMGAARKALAASSIASKDSAGAVVVAPGDANGTLIEFRPG